MQFEQTWRWFGSFDTIPLSSIKQTGASAIVTALHYIPRGEIWPIEDILSRKNEIENEGLTWTVVESMPLHEDIRKRKGNYKTYLQNYKQSIRNLAKCGISTICYDFMPVLDWTRTDIDYQYHDGSTALRFDATAFAAFDLFILKRSGAESDYTSRQVGRAKEYADSLTKEARQTLSANILSGLPGEEEMTMDKFRTLLSEYEDIDEEQLRSNLYQFLHEIKPVTEEVGVRLAIHPDDPPFPLFGLPRILSTEADARNLLEAIDSPCNGLTFCSGSYGARSDNDLPGMIERLGHSIHFVHLRSVKREDDGSFYEVGHLEGDTDMFNVMRALIKEQHRRKEEGRDNLSIPIRPDHGHRMLDDFQKEFYPGYSGIGRLRGLAELRGLEMGIRKLISV